MKTKIIILIGLFFISVSSYSQNACKAYYPFEEGVTFEITNYNKKGKKEGVVNYEVTNIVGNTATIKTIIYDAKGKEVTTTSYDIMCDGNTVSIDFKSMINPDMLKQYKDMEMEVTGTNIELPNDLQVGQSLKDANMNMAINMGGINMNMSVNIVNRKVDQKESITTPAGTFNCFALSYDNEMKMGMKITFKIKEWIAEGVGVVKSESYNKNGKLMGYSELTSFKK
ncbi:hypothetical protein FPF71_05035 [Algibacter amylolyticus]|uniref:DUF3108 domain-containing protein n=1 Tax=Algibacter amylolyticus TaxID=1608400 RepID=A0A5M7BCT1_9FLAO|nr:hypothetical protein [Algibacter amylolyticus]KAA5826178.1 hypothetical protein F2B50_05035 [Algibacter amylolyticus]MBB5268379.1 hypothetical protein [Algibacter amylolyticus]TSJ80216.1 hypothetical protein FPF71_05035 [Algibacter amylolyticus]